MSHEAFLQSIIETPEDDAPRLVYADWLEDHGDPVRAEFIRLQCRHPATDEADPAWHEATPRINLLEEVYGKTWQPEVPEEVRNVNGFRRGFVAVLDRSCESFLAAPDEFDHLSPIEGLCCADIEDHDDGEAFAAHPYLARLRWLMLTAGPFGVTELARSPHLGRLEELDVSSNELDAHALTALAKAQMPRLHALELSFNEGIGGEAVAALLDSTTLPALRLIDLAYCNLTYDDLVRILSSPGLAKMTGLGLQGYDLSVEGASPLVRSPHLGSLRYLCLACTKAGDEGMKALAAGRSMPALNELSLYKADVGPEGMAALAASPALAGLRSLRLHGNRIGPRGAKALAASETMTGLVGLNLDGNQIGDSGAKALAAWPGLADVRNLTLSRNGLTAKGVKALARSPHLRNLVTLHLNINEIGPEGAAALADSALPRRLRYLNLDECGVGPEGASALAGATWSEDLARVNLSGNKIGDRGGRALARSTTLPGPMFFRLEVGSHNSVRKVVRSALEARFGSIAD